MKRIMLITVMMIWVFIFTTYVIDGNWPLAGIYAGLFILGSFEVRRGWNK